MSSIVVVGDVMSDVVARLSGPIARGSDTPAHVTVHPGGAAGNVAAWLGTTGADVACVGRVGDDDMGRAAARALSEAGATPLLAIDPWRATGVCVVLVSAGGRRSMLPDPGANAALAQADLPDDRFVAGAHLHLAGYALLHRGSRPAALAALALARNRAMTISVDPASSAPLRDVGASTVLGWLSGVDLLLPNAAEATALTGQRGAPDAARMLSATAAEVVVTLGARGALWTDGQSSARIAAIGVQRVVDTTGAGDAFTAGLLAARLAGAGAREALAAGARLAARAVARVGARPQ